MAMNREEYVLHSTNMFVETMSGQVTLEELERFADTAFQAVQEQSREMANFLREEGHELDLTKHATHLQMTLGKIQDLKEKFIPALKIRKNDLTVQIGAVQAMGFIRAECEAMECLMR